MNPPVEAGGSVGGILSGLTGLVEKLNELAETGGELRRGGEIPRRRPGGERHLRIHGEGRLGRAGGARRAVRQHSHRQNHRPGGGGGNPGTGGGPVRGEKPCADRGRDAGDRRGGRAAGSQGRRADHHGGQRRQEIPQRGAVARQLSQGKNGPVVQQRRHWKSNVSNERKPDLWTKRNPRN
jgi:hypothetical protein